MTTNRHRFIEAVEEQKLRQIQARMPVDLYNHAHTQLINRLLWCAERAEPVTQEEAQHIQALFSTYAICLGPHEIQYEVEDVWTIFEHFVQKLGKKDPTYLTPIYWPIAATLTQAAITRGTRHED